MNYLPPTDPKTVFLPLLNSPERGKGEEIIEDIRHGFKRKSIGFFSLLKKSKTKHTPE